MERTNSLSELSNDRYKQKIPWLPEVICLGSETSEMNHQTMQTWVLGKVIRFLNLERKQLLCALNRRLHSYPDCRQHQVQNPGSVFVTVNVGSWTQDAGKQRAQN